MRAEGSGERGLQGSGEVLETFFSELWETRALCTVGEEVSSWGEPERAERKRGESQRWSRFSGAKGRSVHVQPWWEAKLTGGGSVSDPSSVTGGGRRGSTLNWRQ